MQEELERFRTRKKQVRKEASIFEKSRYDFQEELRIVMA